MSENSSDDKYHTRFGKRSDKMILDPGDDVRICKRDIIKDEDLKDRFMQKGKVMCKSGKKSVLVKKSDGKIVKKNIRDMKRGFKLAKRLSGGML